jgi:hypothetical protein
MQVIDSFVIPESRYGLNYVRFYRYKRPDDTPVNLSFTVTPKLEVVPAQAPPGAKVTVKGTGFPAESGGAITFDGKPTTLEIIPNKVGTFTAEFIIPATIAGDVHKFVASSPKIFGEVVAANIKVAAGVYIDPANPEVGSNVKIIGSGFAAKSPVKLKYDNVNIANSPSSDENGNFMYSFKLPESNSTDHKFTIEDGAGNSFVLNLKLENSAPPKPTPIAPKAERFGLMGDQDVTFTWSPVSDPSGVQYTIEVGEDLNFFPLKPGMKKTGLSQTDCTINIRQAPIIGGYRLLMALVMPVNGQSHLMHLMLVFFPLGCLPSQALSVWLYSSY